MKRFAVCAAIALLPHVASATTPENVSGLVEQLSAAWNTHDVNKFAGFFTPDAKWVVTTMPRTTAPVRQQTEAFFKGYPDSRCEVTSQSTEDKRVFNAWICKATDPTTKKPLVLNGVDLDMIAADGKIIERHIYFDSAALK